MLLTIKSYHELNSYNNILIAVAWSFSMWYHLISSNVFRRPGYLEPGSFRSATGKLHRSARILTQHQPCKVQRMILVRVSLQNVSWLKKNHY